MRRFGARPVRPASSARFHAFPRASPMPASFGFPRYRVFLSYAREQRDVAEYLAQTLENDGIDVFFDRHDLPAGDAFHARIRAGIRRCHRFVFLVSPDSVTPGSYALTVTPTRSMEIN